MVLVPLLVYPFASMFLYLKECKTGEAVIALSAIILCAYICPTWSAYVNGFNMAYLLRRGAVEMSMDLHEMIDLIVEGTDEDEPIQVIGNSNFIYLKTHRLSSSIYSFQNPIVYMDEMVTPKFIESMENNMPRYVVLQNDDFSFLFPTIDRYELIFVADQTFKLYKLVE